MRQLGDRRLTLGEGNTPLVASRRIGPQAGLSQLYFKLESLNPSGSYKDRFAAAAVSDMLRGAEHACLATSSGNTGAAVAAYCAAAGLDCDIVLVEPTPPAKVEQMAAYGARLVRVRGFGVDPDVTRHTTELLQHLGTRTGTRLLISAYAFSPSGMRGVEAISAELSAQLAERIDHVFCPAGGGGLTLAVARGFDVLTSPAPRPRIECVQPLGNATIAGPLRRGATRAEPVMCRTAIGGLQVPSVLDGDDVIGACRRSGGTGHLVGDDDVYAAQARLAREEGIFAEPAGATALAGILAAARARALAPAARIVCLVTGSGFKDRASVTRISAAIPCPTIDLAELKARFQA